MTWQKNIFSLFSSKYKASLCLSIIRNSSYNCCEAIGCREIVGNGINSECSYCDNVSFPFPAVRFKEITPDLLFLREKEKGDWRNLSVDEKKKLYRISFCQTYAEMLAPSGTWKTCIGKGLVWISVGLWVFLFLKWLWHTDLPPTYAEDRQRAQLKRIITIRFNPIHGLCSKWDYNNDKWK